MAKQFGSFDTALKMRDIVHRMVKDVISNDRPLDREAVVVDFDRGTGTAEVRMAGDTETVEARFPKYKQPKRRTMDNPDGTAPGDIVRVGGMNGDYFIRDLSDGDAYMADVTLLDPIVVTSSGIEDLLALILPQPGDIRYTFRNVAKNGTVLPGNFVCLDGTVVTTDAPFHDAWLACGSPGGGGTWTLADCRDRAPFGASTGGDVALLADDGKILANRGPFHNHNVSSGGGHSHGIDPINHDGIGNAVYTETGSKRIIQLLNGSVNGSHAHGGSTNSGGAHDHGGETGSGAGATNVLGWVGVNWLMKL